MGCASAHAQPHRGAMTVLFTHLLAPCCFDLRLDALRARAAARPMRRYLSRKIQSFLRIFYLCPGLSAGPTRADADVQSRRPTAHEPEEPGLERLLSGGTEHFYSDFYCSDDDSTDTLSVSVRFPPMCRTANRTSYYRRYPTLLPVGRQ